MSIRYFLTTTILGAFVIGLCIGGYKLYIALNNWEPPPTLAMILEYAAYSLVAVVFCFLLGAAIRGLPDVADRLAEPFEEERS